MALPPAPCRLHRLAWWVALERVLLGPDGLLRACLSAVNVTSTGPRGVPAPALLRGPCAPLWHWGAEILEPQAQVWVSTL